MIVSLTTGYMVNLMAEIGPDSWNTVYVNNLIGAVKVQACTEFDITALPYSVLNLFISVLIVVTNTVFEGASANPSTIRSTRGVSSSSPVLTEGLDAARSGTSTANDTTHPLARYYHQDSTSTNWFSPRPVSQTSTTTTTTLMSDGSARVNTVTNPYSWYRNEIWKDYGRIIASSSGTIVGAAFGSGLVHDIFSRNRRSVLEPTSLGAQNLQPSVSSKWLGLRGSYLNGRSGAVFMGMFYGTLVGSWAWGEFNSNAEAFGRIRAYNRWKKL